MAEIAPSMGRWVAIYLRISRDRTGRAENVDIQREQATALVERQWPGVAMQVYCDNDLSAADPGTHRPDYERMLHDIRAGHVAQVVSADQDRLTRQPAEWEALMPVLLTAGITEVHGYRDGITSVEPGKRAPGRFKAAMGAEYVEGLKVKLQEKLDKLADAGRPHGGRTFGYNRGVNEDGEKTLEVIPERAIDMRWAADQVLTGHTLSSVARELEARGHGHWGHSSLIAMLTAPTNAGLRPKRDGDGFTGGTWEAIFDEFTWHRLRTLLGKERDIVRPDGTTRRVGGRRASNRKYLLTVGKAICGRDGCGVELIGRHIRGRKPIYICVSERGGCGKIGATAGEPLPDGEPGVEQTVVARLLERLQSPEFLEALVNDGSAARRDQIVNELAVIDKRRKDIARRWARGDMDEDSWDEARTDLDEIRADLLSELADLKPAGDVDPASIVADWAYMDLAERRTVIDRFVDRVLVYPATPGIKYFDPARVTVEWRQRREL